MRLAVALLGFAAVTVATVLIAQPRMFTGFAAYDDEGYMLVALQSFLDHGSLYDDVFSQYGPFYYEFWGGIFSLFGVPVTHDGGRTVTLVAWVVAALLVGLASWRMTRSILLGLAVQMVCFGAIATVTIEPMHPGGLTCLLLAAILAISSLVGARVSPYAMAALGGTVAALILVKVNVGLFALAALVLTCTISFPALSGRRWLRPLVELGFVALPALLMTSKLSEGWARQYAVHVAVAALAVVIVLRARTVERRSDEELWWLGGGLLAVGLTVCAAILAAGTSPGGLIDGLIGQPLRQTDAFSIELALADRIYFFDLLALLGALMYWYVTRDRAGRPSPTWSAIVSLLSILIGAQMALSVIGQTVLFDTAGFPGFQLGMLCFAWVALVPAPGPEDRATAFVRLLLPPLAVLQALHAFPVAGSQVQWSAFLLAPVGVLCIANGARGLAQGLNGQRERRALAAGIAAVAVVMMVVLSNFQLKRALNQADDAYDGAVALNLPGATEVRVGVDEAQLYEEIAAAIEGNCSSLVTLPGMNSFYIWTAQDPPTGLNATSWTTLFDATDERRVIAATRATDGLCLLENVRLAQGWDGGMLPSGPLVSYLHRGFKPVASFGDYALLKRVRAVRASS